MTNKQRKSLEDLNLMDRFLFSAAMDDPQFVQDVLAIILGEDFALKELPQTEKEQRNLALRKVVRLDVWAQNEREDILDIEVQDTNTGNLPKRSRYYQALIDCNLLEPGDTDYNSLNDVYIIMIASFDLFGKGRYQYTFKMTCQEENDVLLQDHVVRIFLNTKGKDAANISDEMQTLLRYFENTKAEAIQDSASVRLQRIHKHITKLRSSEEMRVKYMREWEEKAYAKAEGRAEGLAEGEAKERLVIAKQMKLDGMPIEQIMKYTKLTASEIEELE